MMIIKISLLLQQPAVMKRRRHIHSSKLNTDSSFSCCRQWQHRLQDRLPISPLLLSTAEASTDAKGA